MRRSLSGAALLLIVWSTAVQAQGSPALVKYGKWLLVSGAIGMNVAAAHAHHDADGFFAQLNDRCAEDPTLCMVGSGGAYLDQESERLYQASVALDHRARNWLIGGEAAALGAAVMFVWEFARPKGPPDNIPFEPKVSIQPSRTDLGVSIRF